MSQFALALKALQLAIAAAEAATRAQEVYKTLKEQGQRDKAFTKEESELLDENAKEIFASPASQISGR